MAWDSTRPVPWQRMIREWIVYVAIFTVVLLVFYRDQSFIGLIAALLVSGPLYMVIGYVMAKLGYQRKTWKELRSAAKEEQPGKSGRGASDDTDDVPGPRPKPAPTKRTGGGRPGGPRKRR